MHVVRSFKNGSDESGRFREVWKVLKAEALEVMINSIKDGRAPKLGDFL
jgi:hypothetical protein